MFAIRQRVNIIKQFNVRGYKKTIEQLVKQHPQALQNALTFVRVDFNVPLDKKTGEITDDTRIKEALPTIKYLKDNGAKVVLASHCGRPKGKFNEKMTMKPMAERLSSLISTNVQTVSDCIGDNVTEAVNKLNGGEILMLENTRFHKEEEANDSDFAKKLSNGAKVYVNDAFGTAHRAHASTEGVAKYCDHKVAGYLMDKELRFLKSAVDKPVHPFTAIIGGAKVSTKLPVLNSLLKKCDNILIGGAMMYTFIKALGYPVGNSLVEDDFIPMVKDLLTKAEEKGVKVHIPMDTIVADKVNEEAVPDFINFTNDKSKGIPDGKLGLDIGPEAIKTFTDILLKSKTVIWNGPMGVFEIKQFATGTNSMAHVLAEVTSNGGTTIIGGGDSVAAVNKAGLSSKMSHISTGGGASLELLEGAPMPGVAALDNE
eukprot:TRINITY_DN84403_c0_g1_i1.p1 TRINITY_DN84403_c0_g1~~TRINITY_DN84403_c0_g1_i1.p1  ORF type:complete len:428 (-),score=13.00 TRINITY_DN84403_c0_g1_i1:4-1287(-)